MNSTVLINNLIKLSIYGPVMDEQMPDTDQAFEMKPHAG